MYTVINTKDVYNDHKRFYMSYYCQNATTPKYQYFVVSNDFAKEIAVSLPSHNIIFRVISALPNICFILIIICHGLRKT